MKKNLEKLPNEILYNIIKWLPLRSLFAMMKVCKKFYEIGHMSPLWKNKLVSYICRVCPRLNIESVSKKLKNECQSYEICFRTLLIQSNIVKRYEKLTQKDEDLPRREYNHYIDLNAHPNLYSFFPMPFPNAESSMASGSALIFIDDFSNAISNMCRKWGKRNKIKRFFNSLPEGYSKNTITKMLTVDKIANHLAKN